MPPVSLLAAQQLIGENIQQMWPLSAPPLSPSLSLSYLHPQGTRDSNKLLPEPTNVRHCSLAVSNPLQVYAADVVEIQWIILLHHIEG